MLPHMDKSASTTTEQQAAPEMVTVGFDHIRALGYDPESKVLEAHFRNVGKYHYLNVPANVGGELMRLAVTDHRPECVALFCIKVEGKFASLRVGN